MKKVLLLIAGILFYFSFTSHAFAASDEATAAANRLNSLGLFKGVGTDSNGKPIYNLDSYPTRQEAITMLVRLIGKENEALTGTWQIPFTDVSSWAAPYVGYAYTQGLTKGKDATNFGGSSKVTAEQYTTFVLRALGYESGADFVWDNPWALSDSLNVTRKKYISGENGGFLRGDIAILSANALGVKRKGSENSLLESIQKKSVSTNSLEQLLSERRLTDEQLHFLKSSSAEKLKEAISTLGDAIAYLDFRFPTLWMSFHLWQGAGSSTAKLRSGQEILNDTVVTDVGIGNAGRSDITTAVAYLLSDDYSIGSLFGFWFSSDGSFNPIGSANYIHSGDKYYVFDSVKGMKGDAVSTNGTKFPTAEVASLTDYIENNPSLKTSYLSINSVDNGIGITFVAENQWVNIISPATYAVWSNENLHYTSEEYQELKYGHIKAENYTKYKLPKMLGGVTLTVDEAKSLVGKDAETIKKSVKTAGDMLMYMLASRLSLENGDDLSNINGHEWHYNKSAKEVLELNKGNCGRMANLANYLLEDDYEIVGFVLHSYAPGAGGGHVYNYIKYNGLYYIVDFSQYLFSNYNESNEFNFISMANLSDYGMRVTECYGGVTEIIAHTSTGTHLPNVWEGTVCYYPEGADFTVLLETNSGYTVNTLPYPSSLPDWREPQ